MKRILILTLTISVFACSYALSQPVTGLDNWFNHETKKDTGQPFHYLWTDTEFSGYSRWGESFIARGAKLTTLEKPDPVALKGIDIYIIVDPDTTSENPSPNYILPEDIKAIYEWVIKRRRTGHPGQRCP